MELTSMYNEPRTLVLLQHKNYYLAKHTLESVLHIVQTVTSSSSRVHPISEEELAAIRLLASMAGVEVKIARNRQEIEELAMQGECELTPTEWVLLDSRNWGG
jgi:hypothetical protein